MRYRYRVKAKPPKKKWEFSKFILGFITICCALWIQQSYVLAFMNRTEVNEIVTVSLSGTVLVGLLGYYAKDYGLKNSLNKFNRTKEEVEAEQEELRNQ